MQKIIFSLLVLSLTVFFACNKDNEGDQTGTDNFDRKAMLTHLADSLIIPAYSNYQSVFNEMKAAADAFVTAPDAAKLSALRDQWKLAYLAWQQVELYNFGPADAALLRNYSNIYPTDTTLLKSFISSGTYDLEALANNKVQGFPALDYLLNGSGNNDTEILENYTTSAEAAQWKKYLGDVVTSMHTKLNKVVSDWKGSYRQQFIDNSGTGAGSSLSLMVNEYIMNFERFLRSGKFGIPAGVMSGVAAPEKVEAFYSKEFGMELALKALDASRDFYLGKSFHAGSKGAGLQTYLQALGKNNQNVATLANNIEAQFGVIRSAMVSLSNSVYDAVENDRTSVLAVYDKMQQQVRYLKVDMTSAIGITISYTDNDGD